MSEAVIFFDIDGTLLNTGGAGQRAMELALTSHFDIDFPFEGVLTAGRTDRGIAIEIFERYAVEDTPENRERFRQAYLSHLPASLNQSPGLLLPGVPALLNQMRSADGLLLSLLTGNYAEGAWIKLRHYELDQYFFSGGFGDTHPNRDDVARQALLSVAEELRRPIAPERTVVVGDTPADIKCARAIGAKAVGVATGHYSLEQLSHAEPDLVLADFSDTSATLNRILELL